MTDYQSRKYKKHSIVSTSERLQSIFTDPSTSAIRPYVEDALLWGAMEIDDQNRVNFYSTSTGTVGFRYEWGTLVEAQDATKVVLSWSPERRHAFPREYGSLQHGNMRALWATDLRLGYAANRAARKVTRRGRHQGVSNRWRHSRRCSVSE